MELSPEQILLVGLVGSGLAAALRLITAWLGGPALGKEIMTIIAGVLSLILAFVFFPPLIPVYADVLQYVGEWLALFSLYVGPATVIYNIILDRLLDKFNLNLERFKS